MRPRTFVFAVAIEDYQDASFPAPLYAEQDAQGFVDAWKDLGAAPDDCQILLSDQATLEAIQAALSKTVKALQPDDRLVVYYAGHSADVSCHGFLTAYDSQANAVDKTTLPMSVFLDEIRQGQSDNVILFFDLRFSDEPFSPIQSYPKLGFPAKK